MEYDLTVRRRNKPSVDRQFDDQPAALRSLYRYLRTDGVISACVLEYTDDGDFVRVVAEYPLPSARTASAATADLVS